MDDMNIDLGNGYIYIHDNNTKQDAPLNRYQGMDIQGTSAAEAVDQSQGTPTLAHEPRTPHGIQGHLASEIPPPILRLPVEIVLHIFQFCLPPDVKDRRPAASQAPLLLCQICSIWRHIAIGSPQFWTAISVDISRDEPIDVQRYCDAAKHWFQRAGIQSPLILNINAPQPTRTTRGGTEADDLVKNVLFPHANRLHQLELCFDHLYEVPSLVQDNIDSSPSTFSGAFEKLECLSLHLEHYPEGQFPVTVFESAPRLRKADLYNVILDDTIDIFLPWAQLTYLYAGDLSDFVWMTLLPQCVNLEQGVFFMKDMDPESENILPTVNATLSRLTDLSLTFNGASGPYIFNGLHFPALTKLTMEDAYLTDSFSWDEPAHMYQQLRSISSLTLSGNMFAFEIIDLLHHTRSLTRLNIRLNDDHSILFNALAFRKQSEPLVPRLEELFIRTSPWRNAAPFSAHIFVNMLLSRTLAQIPSSASPIRHVELSTPWPWSDNVKQEVEAAFPPLNIPGLPTITFARHYFS